MSLKIGERFRPFSHRSGTHFPIPHTKRGVVVYHAALKLLPDETLISLPIEGPVKDFCAILDIEKGGIKVFGTAKNGYFCYWIFGEGFQKVKGLSSWNVPSTPFEKAESVKERLSLGITKKPDWDLVVKRKLVEEIIPYWFFLGQLFEDSKELKGDSLFSDLSHAVKQKNLKDIKTLLISVFETGFLDIFFPLKEDPLHLGFLKPPISKEGSPFALLTHGYTLIRDLLVKEEGSVLRISPLISDLFPFGKAVDLKLSFGTLSFEWTKYKLRTMNLFCHQGQKITFSFPKSLKRCRLNRKKEVNLTSDLTLDLTPNTQYFFDHFEK